MADKEKARRARKRDTDRQSQRHHRERHRAYVQQLEETVKSYRQSCSHSSNPDVVALTADNEKLRERCQRLESLISRIKSLTSSSDPSDKLKNSGKSSPSEGEDAMENDTPAEPADTIQQTRTVPAPDGSLQGLNPPTFSREQAVTSDEAPDQVCEVSVTESQHQRSHARSQMDETSTLEALPSTPTPLAFQNDLVDTSGNTSGFADYAGTAEHGATATSYDVFHHIDFDVLESVSSGRSDISVTGVPNPGFNAGHLRNTEDDSISSELHQCLGSIFGGTAARIDPMLSSFTSLSPLLTQLAKRQHGPSSSLSGSSFSSGPNTAHEVFPNITAVCAWDRILVGIVDEAKTQYAGGSYTTQSPTLYSVLSNRSSDVLAYRLYHLICSYGPMPLQNLLSIFWVQYLVLRWYVLGTTAAYTQLPDFMKPTDLERRIPHSISIGMLVWPDIRRTLIRDSGIMDVETTGAALLHNLSSDWSPSYRAEGDLIGSTDVLSVIERQVCYIDAWKVSRKFGELNPQFARCQLLHYD